MLCYKYLCFIHLLICITYVLGLRTQRFICSIHKLLQLVDSKWHYPNCNELCPKKVKPSGCCLVICGMCSAGHVFLWESSDTVVNQNNIKIHTDNLKLSSVVTLFGKIIYSYHQQLPYLEITIIRSRCFSISIIYRFPVVQFSMLTNNTTYAQLSMLYI